MDVVLDVQQGDKSKHTSIELNLDQLDNFIETLENINKVSM